MLGVGAGLVPPVDHVGADDQLVVDGVADAHEEVHGRALDDREPVGGEAAVAKLDFDGHGPRTERAVGTVAVRTLARSVAPSQEGNPEGCGEGGTPHRPSRLASARAGTPRATAAAAAPRNTGRR